MYALCKSCRMLYGPRPLVVPSVRQNETVRNNRKRPQFYPRVVRRTWGLVGVDRYRKFDTFFSRARQNKRQWPLFRNRLCSWFMYANECGMQIFLLPTHIHMSLPTFKHYVSCGCRWMRFLVRLFCFSFPFLRSCVSVFVCWTALCHSCQHSIDVTEAMAGCGRKQHQTGLTKRSATCWNFPSHTGWYRSCCIATSSFYMPHDYHFPSYTLKSRFRRWVADTKNNTDSSQYRTGADVGTMRKS